MLRLVVHPDGAAAMIQTLRALMLPLQAGPGFIACRIYKDALDDNALCYMEEWRDAGALDHQIRSTHYTRLLELMEEAVIPPDLRLSWVSDVKGLEYLEAVRLPDGDGPASPIDLS